MKRYSIVMSLWACVYGLCAMSSLGAADEVEFFEKRVRPILVERCESCHSTAIGKTSGGLALDTREGWLKGGERGPAIVPSRLEKSLLIQAIRYGDDGPQMPPEDKGGKLTDAEIRTLEEWVQGGAYDPRVAKERIGGMTPEEARQWWAFRPLQPVEPPAIEDQQSLTEIDRFIQADLRTHGLSQAAPADKRTLLRRATFDLTGLPPTPEEVRAFLADHQPEAFARVVNRLLDSPAYGERWGRHWLDTVRYADFFQANPQAHPNHAQFELHEAYRYRDWVVSAFNRDLPYDQFVVQQIAGDVLADPANADAYRDHLTATGVLSIGPWDNGDADKDKIVSDIVDDQIDVIGKAFLGLTVSCARCHDHKFDPLSTEDYYALAGMFYSTRILADVGTKGGHTNLQRRPWMTPIEQETRKQREAELAALTVKIDEATRQRMMSDLNSGGSTLVPTKFTSSSGAIGTISADHSILVSGSSLKDIYTVEATVPAGVAIRALRLEVLPDPSLPAMGPGRAPDGNFVLNRFTVAFTPPATYDSPQTASLVKVIGDHEQSNLLPNLAATISPEDRPLSGWAVHPFQGQAHVAVYEIASNAMIPAESLLTISLHHSHADQYNIGKFRLSVLDSVPTLNQPDELTAKRVQLRDALKQAIGPSMPLVLAVQEGGTPGSLFPTVQDVNLHIRGSHTKLGPVVKRRLPQFFAGHSQPEITGSGRLQVARWIASRDNPLTARVLVNRVWQHHFGEGIVRTPNNFGKLGETPSHPELLDWLALRFMEEGWSIKQLHRRLMLSATYQQASRVPRDEAARDPDNRWLGRMNSRRLEAEALRDAMLAASGQLDPTPGGPATADLAIRRRSLYVSTTRWDRGNFSTLFDAANPDAPVEKRTSSTVSPQALFLLNNPFVQTEAKHLAARLATEATDDPQRVQLAYALLFARLPTDREVQQALSFVSATSWDDYAHMLLCSNEFTYID